MRESSKAPITINMVIDEAGHTAAHWAASLGRLTLLRDFIDSGVNLNAQNYHGETPLVRAVTTDNLYDSQMFPELLRILDDNLFSVDKHRCTIMHLLAHLGRIERRSKPSLYYMKCIQTHLSKISGDRLAMLVNAKDWIGDTALHLACRSSSIAIIELLLEMGARRDIKNLAQKTPDDCVDPFSDVFRFLFPKQEDNVIIQGIT